MAGQTISDRLLAARHSLAGQGLAKSVCKATTEEMISPKKKHLDYLVHCTNEPNVSIPHLANLLVERTQNANWVVVYKSLITVHHLLAYGNERFMQYLASSNSTFNLNNFLDKGGVQGTVGARIGYDMSPFIRRYAKYLNDKALSYRTVAFDFCKVKRGKEEGSLRTMNADKLLKTLPVLQSQLDGLLEFDCQANDLSNSVINMCFMLLFRDLIRLFACYNDGIINLLEKYFDMNKKQCKDALDLYKRFLVRMDRVGEFLKVAENVGIDKGDIPDLTKAPSSLLDALEGHLATLEGRKVSAANTPTQSTNSTFGSGAARYDAHASNGIDDVTRAQALAEEEAAMNQYKQTKVVSPTSAAVNNPFLSSPTNSGNIVDLFSAPAAQSTNAKASDDLLQLGNPFADMFGSPMPNPAPMPVAAPPANAFVSDSNFSSVFGASEPVDGALPNPFLSDTIQPGDLTTSSTINKKCNVPPMRPPLPMCANKLAPINGSAAISNPKRNVFDDLNINNTIRLAFDSNKNAPMASMQQQLNGAKNAPNLSMSGISCSIGSSYHEQQTMHPRNTIGGPNFGTEQQHYSSPSKITQGFDALGDVLKPASTATAMPATQTGNALGSVLLNSGQMSGGQQPPAMSSNSSGRVLTGDLDSSLASLAENLTINKSASAQVKGPQWNSPAKTGATGWSPQPMAATTGANYRPMAQGITVSPAPSTVQYPFVHAPYSAMTQYLPQQGMAMRTPMMAGSQSGMVPMGMMGMQGAVSQQQQQQQFLIPQQTAPLSIEHQNGKANNIQLDPFGAF